MKNNVSNRVPIEAFLNDLSCCCHCYSASIYTQVFGYSSMYINNSNATDKVQGQFDKLDYLE